MSPLKVWIGSSVPGLPLAEAVLYHLRKCDDLRCRMWDEGTFVFGAATLESLEEAANDVDVAILCLTPDDELVVSGEQRTLTPRDNVIFELGFFMGALGRDRAIAFHQDLGELRTLTDLSGIERAIFRRRDGESIEEAVHNQCHKIKNHILKLGPRPRPPRRRVTNRILERGDTHSLRLVADAALDMDLTDEARQTLEEELLGSLRSEKPIPAKYLYMTPTGSRHWIDLCRKQQYMFYYNSLQLIGGLCQTIADEVRSESGEREFDLVSVGSGDGAKDALLLKALCDGRRRGEITYYYPIDISESLVLESIHNSRGTGLPDTAFKLKAVHGDYQRLRDLSTIYEDRPQPNIFALFGNSLGNADEFDLLRAVRESMQEGDFVLIEINAGDPQKTKAAEDTPGFKEHDFTPLDALGVPFDAGRMRYDVERDRSVFGNTASVLARYTMGEPDKTSRRLPDEVCLSVIHHYDFASFVPEVAQRLHTKVVWKQEGDNALVLARRE
jgi:hypothetical protein